MTQQIGDDVYFTAFENFTLSSSEETEEIDLVEKDTNFVLSGSEEGYDVDISFVFVPNDFYFADDILERIKNLSSRDVTENTIDFQGYQGRVSVSDVSFPNDAQEDNIRRGSISGIFLPWPKHFGHLNEPASEEYGSVYGSGGYGEGPYGMEYNVNDYSYGSYNSGDYGE